MPTTCWKGRNKNEIREAVQCSVMSVSQRRSGRLEVDFRRTRSSRTSGPALRLPAVLAGVAATSVLAPQASAASTPDVGPNVRIFDPFTLVATISAYLQGISAESEFSSNRHAVLFKPGVYGSAAGQNNPSTATGIVNSEVGYYTSIAGLDASRDDVLLNGALHTEPDQNADGTSSSLTKFRRSARIPRPARRLLSPTDRGMGRPAHPLGPG